MAFYQYKAVTAEGRVVEGTLEAADEKTVLARLAEQGQMPIRVSSNEEKGLLGKEFNWPWQKKRVSQSDLLVYPGDGGVGRGRTAFGQESLDSW